MTRDKNPVGVYGYIIGRISLHGNTGEPPASTRTRGIYGLTHSSNPSFPKKVHQIWKALRKYDVPYVVSNSNKTR